MLNNEVHRLSLKVIYYSVFILFFKGLGHKRWPFTVLLAQRQEWR